MKINSTNIIFNNYKYNNNPISFKNTQIPAKDFETFIKTGKKALTDSKILKEEAKQINKNIANEVKSINKIFSKAKKDGFIDEYYENGDLKREFRYAKEFFSYNARITDYLPNGNVSKITVFENSKIKSININNPNGTKDTYLFDNNKLKIAELGENKKIENSESITKWDKIFKYNNNGDIKTITTNALRGVGDYKFEQKFEFNQYNELEKFYFNSHESLILNTNLFDCIYSFDNNKTKLIEINVEEDGRKYSTSKKRTVDRTIKCLN